MPNYRRVFVPGAYYFFTVVTKNRKSTFADPMQVRQIRTIWQQAAKEKPFETVAAVVLPDHIHSIWRMPGNDTDYPSRWRLIKGRFVSSCGGTPQWQRGYWEHTIRDAESLKNHIDYIHYNPVKHGLVGKVCDWPWSSFHRYVKQGLLPPTGEHRFQPLTSFIPVNDARWPTGRYPAAGVNPALQDRHLVGRRFIPANGAP